MVTKDLGLVTAYAYAVAGGYTGTEEEFQALLGNIAIDLAEIENLSVTVTTLPAGSSATASYDSGVLSLGIPKGDKGDSGDVANVAPEFSTSTPYDEGDYVIYNDLLYKFKAAKAAGAWDSTKVEAKTVGDELTALKEDIKDNYAKNDGYYDGMTVGNAEQIVGTVFEEDDTAYNYRTTGGSAEVGDRAYVESITGGSVVWNQIFAPERLVGTYSTKGVTFTNNGDGSMTITGTAEQNSQGPIAPSIAIPKGHKYFFFVSDLVGSDTTFVWSFWANNGANYISNTNYGYILREMASNHDNVGVWLNYKEGYTYNMTIKPNVFDLTAMFGSTIADYIYSLETAHAGDGVAWFRRYFPEPYYAYHAVGMEHVNAVAAKTVGFNQWDGEYTDHTLLNSTNGQATTNSSYPYYTTDYIKVVPNMEYYFNVDILAINSGSQGMAWYDSDKNYISGAPFNSAFNATKTATSPSNACYLRYCGKNTNVNAECVILHWDNSRDGDYEPYNLHTYPLADLTLRGIPKKDESGNLYFDGDRYLPDGTVERRYGIVDLGTLTWTYNSSYVRFLSTGLRGIAMPATNDNNDSNVEAICSIYGRCGSYIATADSGSNKKFAFGDDGSLAVRDESYTDAATFKTAMSGVYLVYELAEPTTEEADPYQYPMVVDNWGTEEFVDGLVESGDRDVAIPVGHETKYPPNLKDKLESAANNPDSDGAYILTHDGGSNTYTPLASNPTIQNIIARLEALEGGGE